MWWPVICSPNQLIVPSSVLRRPARQRRSVDFPAPGRPTSPTISPAPTSRLTSRSAGIAMARDLAPEWYVLLRPLTDKAIGTVDPPQTCADRIAAYRESRAIVDWPAKSFHRAMAWFFHGDAST